MSYIRKIKAGLVPIARNQFVGEPGTIFYDPDNGTLYLSDGTTVGGIAITGGGGGGSGYTGSQGIQGIQGNIGYTGSQGEQGVVAQGSAPGDTDVLWLDTSVAGISGLGYTGSQGSLGFTGSTGSLGYTGSVGTAGSLGYTGSQGAQGDAGAIGYAGSVGTGYTGSAGIGYTGSQGSTGYTGSGFGGNVSSVVSITYPDYITFDTSPNAVTVDPGTLTWNDGDGTLDLGLKGGTAIAQLGQDTFIRVYNNAGSTLNKGEIVYITGSHGNRLSVSRAQANAESTSAGTVGMVAENINNGAEGFVLAVGTINKLDTSGLVAGNAIYLSANVAGAYTQTKPVSPNHLVVLGWVERVDNTVGSIYIKVDNGYEIGELHNVYENNPQNGQALVYDSANSRWTNSNNPGYTGSQGFLGSTGFTGSLGYTGSEGAQGIQGNLGYVGSQGSTGFVGSLGYTGSEGTNGYTGSEGAIGLTGYTGSSGAAQSSTYEAPFSVQSTTFTATANTRYLINAINGNVVAILPSTPSIGSTVYFTTGEGFEEYTVAVTPNAAYGGSNVYITANTLTVFGNGANISGTNANIIVWGIESQLGLVYTGTQWRTYAFSGRPTTIIGNTVPAYSSALLGQQWYNPETSNLYVFNGASWVPVVSGV